MNNEYIQYFREDSRFNIGLKVVIIQLINTGSSLLIL